MEVEARMAAQRLGHARAAIAGEVDLGSRFGQSQGVVQHPRTPSDVAEHDDENATTAQTLGLRGSGAEGGRKMRGVWHACARPDCLAPWRMVTLASILDSSSA